MACRRRQSRNVVSPRRIVRQVRSTSTYCVAPEGRKQEFLPAGGLSLGHQGTNGSGFCKHQTRA